jgi:hypothetical protein
VKFWSPESNIKDKIIMKKYIVIGFLSIFLFITIITALFRVPNLRLVLDITRDEYQSGENIQVFIELVNEGNNPLVVNKRMAINDDAIDNLGEVAFIVTTPTNNRAFFYPRVRITPPEENDFRELEAGESVGYSFTLNEWFSPLSQPGRYTVQAVYRNYSNPGDGRIAWQGELHSYVASFNIVP